MLTWSTIPSKTAGTRFCEFLANKSFNFMIVFYGSPKSAKRFSCTCSLENKDGEKFSYTGKIHTLDEKKDEIIASDSLFKIGKNAVMRSLDEESDFEITFTISEEKTGYYTRL